MIVCCVSTHESNRRLTTKQRKQNQIIYEIEVGSKDNEDDDDDDNVEGAKKRYFNLKRHFHR